MIFLFTIAIGAIIGFLFDITRILRRVFKHKNWVVYLEDSLLWIVTLLIVLYFVFNFADGRIRFFYFWGFTIGGSIYFACFSRFVILFSTRIANIIKSILKKMNFFTKIKKRLVNNFKKSAS
ncbi:MAG: spore cortex biosynthesis protein YabQ [Defluviitaleaceae bacterium]|nr:spore cortex biosynthesis protein YabQ [Defluviitaleaceae bacterium]